MVFNENVFLENANNNFFVTEQLQMRSASLLQQASGNIKIMEILKIRKLLQSKTKTFIVLTNFVSQVFRVFVVCSSRFWITFHVSMT